MKFNNLPKICTTIGNLESTKLVPEIASKYSFIELRADTIPDFYETAHTLDLKDVTVIVTDYSNSFNIEYLVNLPFASMITLPDTLGLDKIKEYASLLKAKSILSIAAFHAYKPIIDLSQLYKVYDSLSNTGADLIKIIITANNYEDVDTVLNLYEKKPDNLIAFAMGSISFSSRLRCLGLGAPFTFAHADELAPFSEGQPSYKIMLKLINNGSW